MGLFETLTPQPYFPDEDLQEVNAAHISYYLQHNPESVALEKSFHDSMRTLHQIGHNALEICGIKVDYSQDEYHAFCSGFAAIEYTSTLIRERQHDTTMVVANARNLLIDAGEMADFEVASRYGTWVEEHPNTHGVIVDAGAARGETMKQLQLRTAGAHLASEIWMERLPRI